MPEATDDANRRPGPETPEHVKKRIHGAAKHRVFAVFAVCAVPATPARGGNPASCCLPESTCAMLSHKSCTDLGGDPGVPGSTCDDDICRPRIWSQPPLMNDGQPECLRGWGEASVYHGYQLALDDFVLPEGGPISAVYWWGTYFSWDTDSPPPDAPPFFHISLWDHLPSGAGDPPIPYPHPGSSLAEWTVPRSEVNERYAGCVLDPLLANLAGTGFRYEFLIPEEQWYVVQPGQVVWLGIVAAYHAPDCACNTDNAVPVGTLNQADVDFVTSRIGCTVGAGDPECDLADADCDGDVDTEDVAMVECQVLQAWADPACCPLPDLHEWGWISRPLSAGNAAFRMTYPTAAGVGSTCVLGEPVVDEQFDVWNLAFTLAGEPSSTAVPDPPGPEPVAVAKNRYLSFEVPAGWSGTEVAARVRLIDLPLFSGFNGSIRWLQPPVLSSDSPLLGTTFQASAVGCEPVFTLWPAGEVVHVYGIEVVPGSGYELAAVDRSCEANLGDEGCYSAALSLTTSIYGDVIAPFGGATEPSFLDIGAIVVKFKDHPSAVPKPQAQLQPDFVVPSAAVGFQDILEAVRGFKRIPYGFSGPGVCP